MTLENVKLGDLTLLETLNWIVVPVGSLLKVLVSAIDVIHSFSIPALGVKVDAIPGRLTTFWLISNVSGNFYGQCSELCGSLHGFMPVKVTFI